MTMRGWRHDYHNHMQSLKAYLAMDDISEAKVYLDKLETDLDDINLLFDTGNIGVDAKSATDARKIRKISLISNVCFLILFQDDTL